MSLSISKDIAVQLVKNYFAFTQKFDAVTGNLRPLDAARDAYTIWFSKKDIDGLFSANNPPNNPIPNDQFGLRVYLGMHSDTLIEGTVEAYAAIHGGLSQPFNNYIGQHCVILVATVKDANGVNNDQLDNSNTVSVVALPNMGAEYGGICPPPGSCGGVTVLPV